MQSATVDRAGIVAPPPAIYLGIFGVGLLLEWIWPTQVLTSTLTVIAGSVALVCGVLGAVAAIRSLLRANTPVNPYKATAGIVTDGLFRYSRNPIYVSDMLLYVGLSLVVNTWWPLALTPILVWTMNAGVIAREEAYLERKFGDDYLSYKQRVRRWI